MFYYRGERESILNINLLLYLIEMSSMITDFLNTIKIDELTSVDEATLKQTVILKLFSLLGWDIFSSREVVPEFSIGGKKVDYALCDEGKPRVFIEVKRSCEDLSNHQEQLLSYAFMQGIRLAVLTNGTTWWFYLSLQEASWEERKFDSLDISRNDLSKFSEKIFNYLNKENVLSNKAVEIASQTFKEMKKKRTLDDAFPRAWGLIVNENNIEFMEILNKKIEDISGFRASKENLERYIRNQLGKAPISMPDNNRKVQRRIPIPKTTSVNYWLIPFKDPSALRRLIVEENIWAFGENTPGRKSVKPGDWVCFYLSKSGVVAHGQVSSNPTYLKHPKVRDPEKYPWVFKLINTVVYPEFPTRLDKDMRKRLDSFKDRDPDKRWGWFVQTNRKITEHDFKNLTQK